MYVRADVSPGRKTDLLRIIRDIEEAIAGQPGDTTPDAVGGESGSTTGPGSAEEKPGDTTESATPAASGGAAGDGGANRPTATAGAGEPDPISDDEALRRLRQFLRQLESLLAEVAEAPGEVIPGRHHERLRLAWVEVRPSSVERSRCCKRRRRQISCRSYARWN